MGNINDKNPEADFVTGKPVLFMGCGNHGKTSTIRNLRGEPFDEPSPTTWGTHALEWDLDGEKALILDHPGQEPGYQLAAHIMGNIRKAIFVLVMKKTRFCTNSSDYISDEKYERLFRELAMSYLRFRPEDMPTICAFTHQDAHHAQHILKESELKHFGFDSLVQVENRSEDGAENLRREIKERLADIEPIRISLVELYASQVADLISNENSRFEKGVMGFYTAEEFDEFWEFLLTRVGDSGDSGIPEQMQPKVLSILREKGIIHDRDGKIYIPLGACGDKIGEYSNAFEEMPVHTKLSTDFAKDVVLGLRFYCADRIVAEGTDSFQLVLRLDSGKILGMTARGENPQLQLHSDAPSEEVHDFMAQVMPMLREFTFDDLNPLIGCSCEKCLEPENRRYFFVQAQITGYMSGRVDYILCHESFEPVEDPQAIVDTYLRYRGEG